MNPDRKLPGILAGSIPVSAIQAGSIRMAYSEIGTGEPLLLIMGLGGSMHEWDRTFLSLLAARYHIIIFDNRGIGDSEKGDMHLTIPGMADDLHHLLNGLGRSRVHLLGYSLGATVAVTLAERFPDLAGSLILYAPCIDGGEAVRMISRYIDPTLPELIRIQALLPDDFLGEHPDIAAVFPPPAHPVNIPMIYRQLAALENYRITDNVLATIRNPTLILAGSEDRISTPHALEGLAEKMKHADTRIIPGGGHAMMYQVPDLLACLVIEFLDSTGLMQYPR